MKVSEDERSGRVGLKIKDFSELTGSGRVEAVVAHRNSEIVL